MLRDILEIQRYAQTMCASASVKTGRKFHAKFDENTQYPYTTDDGKTISIVLPQPNAETTDEEYIKNRHFVIHETLHHTEGPDVQEVWRDNKIPRKNDDPLNHLCMAAEDYRIEHSGSRKYAGDAKSINEYSSIMVEKFIGMTAKMSEEQLTELGSDKFSAGMMAAVITDMKARDTWCTEIDPKRVDVLKNSMPKLVQEGCDKLDSIDYGTKLQGMRTEQDAIDVAKEAFNILFDEDADDHCEQQAQQEGQGQGEEGEGESGQASGGQGEAQQGEGNEAGQGKGETDEPGDGQGQPVNAFSDIDKTIKYNKLLLSDHGDCEGGSGNGMNIEYDEDDYSHNGTFTPTPLAQIKVEKYKKGDQSIVKSYYRYEMPEGAGVTTSRSFANKVRRLVQIKSQARYIGGQTRGKLNRKQLYRVGCPTVGNGEWNSKVFKKRFQDEVLDTTIQLVVDASGSMSGKKYNMATHAALMLNHAFDHTLHMPVEILTFSEKNRRLCMGLIKSAGKRLTEEDITHNFGAFASQYMSMNSDGEALMYAAHRLRQAQTKRKIMIVLSDGSPASSRGGDEIGFTQQAVDEIVNEGVIDIYGIGIMHNAVSRYYPDYEVINNISELEPAILRVIKRKLNV